MEKKLIELADRLQEIDNEIAGEIDAEGIDNDFGDYLLDELDRIQKELRKLAKPANSKPAKKKTK